MQEKPQKNLNQIYEVYEILIDYYGEPSWWPVKFSENHKEFEIIVGAILTQNTNWSNVEKALANFGDFLTPEKILEIDTDVLAQIIKPAGFFNQKAAYLKNITQWFAKYDFDVEKIKRGDLHELRRELLAIKGVGEETADSILLYAFDFPTFVIDAYTKRLISRIFGDDDCTKYTYRYSELKALFEQNLPSDVRVYNNFHALIVIHAKAHCRKSKSLCEGCPLAAVICPHKNS